MLITTHAAPPPIASTPLRVCGIHERARPTHPDSSSSSSNGSSASGASSHGALAGWGADCGSGVQARAAGPGAAWGTS